VTGAEGWLALFRRACDEVGARVGDMDPAQRRQPVGRGAGGDVTMVVDQVAEDVVIEVLAGSGRPMRLVSEEIGERQLGGPGGPVVVVDPIDGSLNAKRGLPVFATSIALAEGPAMGDVTLGVIRDHGTGEEWIAERGRGARVDGRLLTPLDHDATALDLLLVEGSYPSKVGPAAAALDGRVGRFRALGSLALSLCHAGAGRCDAMVGLGPGRSVDVAAAQLVAREAGLLVGLPRVADLAATPLDLDARFHVVAARDAATMDLLAGLL
jgi:myo-inositol-1(or 4)-monophosphatase